MNLYSKKYGKMELCKVECNDYIKIFVKTKEGNKIFHFEKAYKNSIFFDEDFKDSYSYYDIYSFLFKFADDKYKNQIGLILEKKYPVNQDLYMDLLKYDFDGFYHQTSINNLLEILNDGYLFSRKKVNRYIHFKDVANKEVLDNTDDKWKDYVRLYLKYKTPTNYNFELCNRDEMVYLRFKYCISNIDGAIISDGNLASRYTSVINVSKYKKNYFDFSKCFERESMDDNGKFEKIRKRNAEIAIPNKLSIKYLDSIIFKNKKTYEKFKKMCSNLNLLQNINIIIDDKYFFNSIKTMEVSAYDLF